MKKFYLFFFVGLMFSCSTYKMLDGKSYPVYFTSDSSIKRTEDFFITSLAYTDMYNLRGNILNSLILEPNTQSTAIINRPTIFIAQDRFLVYPREKLGLKKVGANEISIYTLKGNKRRDNELEFFKKFNNRESYPEFPFVENASVSTVLELESRYKSEILIYQNRAYILYDSLLKTGRLSKRFINYAKNYVKHRYDFSLFFLYRKYKDVLEENNLYKTKNLELLSLAGQINEQEALDNHAVMLNEILDIVMPHKTHKPSNENQVKASFNFAMTNLNGFLRDYVLSKVMYYALVRRIDLSTETISYYNKNCINPTYKKIIKKILLMQTSADEKSRSTGNNSLVRLNKSGFISLEEEIKKQEGKIIYIDFWATWCAACIEELPALRQIEVAYTNKDISFIRISIEKDLQTWRKFVSNKSEKTSNNFLIAHHDSSSFVKKYNITSIPRYFLFGKDGRIISADAPSPSNPELVKLIDQYLSQKKDTIKAVEGG